MDADDDADEDVLNKDRDKDNDDDNDDDDIIQQLLRSSRVTNCRNRNDDGDDGEMFIIFNHHYKYQFQWNFDKL